MFDYRLALATGVDIPIPELQTVIHQPTIKEISRDFERKREKIHWRKGFFYWCSITLYIENNVY